MTTTTLSLAGAPPRGPLLLCRLMLGLTVLGITFGAMVTSTGSGMAFTDWPTSDGGWMPERALATLPGFLEHFHRLIFATVGLLMLILTIWIGVREQQRPGLRRLAVAGLVLVIVQGIFGGVGVRLGTPAWTSVTHGVLAQITLATFATLLAFLTPAFLAIAPQPAAARAGRFVVGAALALLLVQTTLGAIARHSGNEIALWLHVGHALVVFLVLVIASALSSERFAAVPAVRKLARGLLLLVVAQVVLGFVALLMRMGKQPENIDHLWACSLISAHVLVGALLTLLTTLLLLTVVRAGRA